MNRLLVSTMWAMSKPLGPHLRQKYSRPSNQAQLTRESAEVQDFSTLKFSGL